MNIYNQLTDKHLAKEKHQFKLFAVALLLLILIMPELALAQVPTLPSGKLGIPGVDGNTSVMKTLGLTIGFVGFIFVIAILVFGLGDTMASFFRQLNDSRKEGDWSPLIKFVAITFVVLAIVFVLMGYITTYAFEPINKLT